MEVRQFHQYVVRVDGSGRVTLRNRQHLRKFIPFLQRLTPLRVQPHNAPAQGQGLPTKSLEPRPIVTTSLSPSDQHPDTTGPSSEPPPPTPMEPMQQPSQTQPASHKPSEHDSIPLPCAGVEPAPVLTPHGTPPMPEKKLPRALARLLPHNAAGCSEMEHSSRRKPRCDK